MSKQFLKVSLVLLALLFTAETAFARNLQPYFHKVNCPNGFNDAYSVTIVDLDTGCVEASWGVDCSGQTYTMPPRIVPVTGEPTDPYTFMHTGTATNGATIYVKIQLNAEGGISKVWGENASGGYYIAEFSN